MRRKWAKRLQVQMKSQVYDSLDRILIISFFSAFKIACDTNEVQEWAVL